MGHPPQAPLGTLLSPLLFAWLYPSQPSALNETNPLRQKDPCQLINLSPFLVPSDLNPGLTEH